MRWQGFKTKKAARKYHREYQRRWARKDRKKHPLRYRRYWRSRWRDNKTGLQAKQKRWIKKNIHRVRRTRHRYYLAHKEQVNRQARLWKRRNRKRLRWLRLQAEYGLSEKGYWILYRKQKGLCGVCVKKLSMNPSKVDVDHDHSRKRVRGLLHHLCNLGLGSFKDSIASLRGAIRYLGLTKLTPQ